MTEGTWNLHADPVALDRAAAAWASAGQAFDTAAEAYRLAGQDARSEWEGAAAESFDVVRRTLLEGLDTASETAAGVAAAMQSAAGAVRSAQGQLDASWASVMSLPRTYGPYGSITFTTETEEELARARAAADTAADVRSSLAGTLLGYSATVRSAIAVWRSLVADWGPVADGATAPFDVPVGPGDGTQRVGVVVVGGQVIFSGGDGNERITVTIDPDTGEQIVTVTTYTYVDNAVVEGDPVTYRLPAGKHLVIRGGGGEDIITLPTDSTIAFTVTGGSGRDRISSGGGEDRIFGLGGDDEVTAGGGADYVSGGAGHDYLDAQAGDDTVFGGAGNDTLYGLDGDDALSGGTGRDYLEGGEGDDALDGGQGDDILSGGRGDDALDGGLGDDLAYGGHGRDVSIGGTGTDTSIDDARAEGSTNEVNTTVELPPDLEHITIEGSPEFVARVRADLDLLGSSPAGSALLANLEQRYEESGFLGMGKSSLVIREWEPPSDQPFGQNSTASNGGLFQGNVDTVRYLPSIDDFRGAPPVVVLQHELAHVYDYANGTFVGDPYTGSDTRDTPRPGYPDVSVGERQASGLPIDHDGNPATPEIIDPDHPIDVTENGLREEMGLPTRESYR
ncbi:M91 family zinc metallopeptidase [Miniimonas sp. S16]|uniref:M91 family zinc metallopeptidase n=1 Tax=Miniimonas sp. S16 TaxID=2171623 RepID=UPI000D529F6D|nr:M91 family zinc metallopeptidase [Miniimonas sp. S16]